MAPVTLHALQVAITFAAYNVAAWLLVVPRLDVLPRPRSLVWTTLPLSLRHLSATMLAPSITSPSFDAGYKELVAYADLVLSVLALVVVVALARTRRLGVSLAWIFHVVGLAELLYAVFAASRLQAAALFGAHWYIVALGAPLTLILHLLSLRTLLRRR